MAVYLSPDAKLKLCELIAKRVEEANLKLYATLARAGLKGPAFYAYIQRKSVPSDEVAPRIVSLAVELDRAAATKIIQEDLEGFSEFVDKVMGLATAGVQTAEEILASILGPPSKPRRKS
jgi:hypothetical protein